MQKQIAALRFPLYDLVSRLPGPRRIAHKILLVALSLALMAPVVWFQVYPHTYLENAAGEKVKEAKDAVADKVKSSETVDIMKQKAHDGAKESATDVMKDKAKSLIK